jgi:hypothetical protein
VSDQERDAGDVFRHFVQRRRDKIRAEIDRNRRGEYTVPTWALAVVLVLIIAFCVWLYIF